MNVRGLSNDNIANDLESPQSPQTTSIFTSGVFLYISGMAEAGHFKFDYAD